MSSATDGFKDEPVVQTLKIVDVIDCVAGNAPDSDGRPISMLTFAHLGELEQTLAVSFEDTKRLVTRLLESLAAHGNECAIYLLDKYFLPSDAREDDDDDLDEGEAWKKETEA
jgi:hypothetical protein